MKTKTTLASGSNAPTETTLRLRRLLTEQRLRLEEAATVTWHPKQSATVSYVARDSRERLVAQAEFIWTGRNRAYVPQGLDARAGSARHAALAELLSTLEGVSA